LEVAGAVSVELARQLKTVALADSAASESVVRNRLPAAPLVHLATHGYAYQNEVRARDSWLALAPGRRDDGLFTVGEILDGPPLKADLVVLAACTSGLGNSTQAEGTVGFQRALLAKGARSVMVSLWTVDEAATARLMEVFYREWLGPGHPAKSEALRRAQESVRTDREHPDWKHPSNWAAFQLVGAR
jgi:CHAT domain-containing protein